MNRVIYINTEGFAEAEKLARQQDIKVISPTAQAARSLQVPHFSLQSLAQQIIAKDRFAEVPVLTAYRCLQETVKDVLPTADIEGTTRRVAPTLKELLRIGSWQDGATPLRDAIYRVSTASCQEAGVNIPGFESSIRRFEPLAQLAKAYQQRLRAKKLVDPAEIFWFASQLNHEKRESLLVYGYDFPHMDELQFLNAVAGDRSVLFLPVVNHPLFADNQRSLLWLQEQGWEAGERGRGGEGERGRHGDTETRRHGDTERGEGVRRKDVETRNVETRNFASLQMRDACESVGQQLCQRFLGLQSKEPDRPVGNSPNVELYIASLQKCCVSTYPHLEAEVRGVLGQVKELLLQDIPANQIALVARNETNYGSVLLDIAWEYDLPIRALYSIPLAVTRLGAWIEALGKTVMADLPFEATAKLLTHPLCSGLSPEIWVQARKSHPSGLANWQKILHPEGVDGVDLERAIDLSILSWPSEDSRENWVERLQHIFKAFNLRKRAARWAREAVAYYTFQEGLVHISKPETEILTLEEFIEEISQLTALLTVPAAPGRGGVELHTPASLVGSRYQFVFVLGMAEGLLPAPVVDNVVLDFRDRQLLRQSGIPVADAVATAQLEALSFYGLLKTATQNLTLSYPRLIDRMQMLPSPYIQKLGLTVEAAPPLSVASVELSRQVHLRDKGALEISKGRRQEAGGRRQEEEEGKRVLQIYVPASQIEDRQIEDRQQLSEPDRVLSHAYHSWTVEMGRESGQPPDEYDGAIAIGSDPDRWVFSASQLTNLGQCPFKWFSQKLLHLLDLEEAEEELSASLRGRLYHKTLELSVNWAKQQPLTPPFEAFEEGETTQIGSSFPDIQSAAIAYLETAFWQAERSEKLDKLPPFPGWAARRQEHLTRLLRAVSATDFLKEETEVLTAEQKFTGTWYGLKVKGTVDRVDRTPEGLAIVDYKTSSSIPKGVKDANGKAKLDIQLPLYIQVAASELFPEEEVVKAYYYSLGKARAFKPAQLDETTLAEFAENVKRRLQQGHYPVDPDIERAACQYCDYDLVCRQGARLSRK